MSSSGLGVVQRTALRLPAGPDQRPVRDRDGPRAPRFLLTVARRQPVSLLRKFSNFYRVSEFLVNSEKSKTPLHAPSLKS